MRSLGWVLVLCGLLLALAGVAWALLPVLGLYQAAMEDPLSDKMPEDGKGIASAMIPGVVVLGVGAVMSVAGKVMLIAGMARKKRGDRRAAKGDK